MVGDAVDERVRGAPERLDVAAVGRARAGVAHSASIGSRVGPLRAWRDEARPLFVGCERRLTYNQMVVDELTDEAVDHLFHALADATRRDILRRCVRGELSVSRLATPIR